MRNRHGGRISLLKPDPQVISRELFTRQQSDPEHCRAGTASGPDAHCDYVKAPFFNVLAAFWIQFMTHDWFAHLDEGKNAAELMAVGCADRYDGATYRPLTEDEVAALGCRPGDRADEALMAQTDPPPTFDDNGRTRMARAPRTTSNLNTAWWDASQLYGYSARSAQRVKRDPNDPAKLLMVPENTRSGTGDEQGYLPTFAAGDPILPSWAGQEATAFPDNWSIGTSFYHNLFAREHNLFVDEFRRRALADPDADSGLRDPAHPDQVIRYGDVQPDLLFQVARLVVAAEIAKIHTIEWTTQLLYDEPLYQAMNANWHGLVRTDNKVSRALAHVAVDRLGRSFNETDQTQWFSVFASGAGITGLGSHRYAEGDRGFLGIVKGAEDIWSLSNPDHVQGGVEPLRVAVQLPGGVRDRVPAPPTRAGPSRLSGVHGSEPGRAGGAGRVHGARQRHAGDAPGGPRQLGSDHGPATARRALAAEPPALPAEPPDAPHPRAPRASSTSRRST